MITATPSRLSVSSWINMRATADARSGSSELTYGIATSSRLAPFDRARQRQALRFFLVGVATHAFHQHFHEVLRLGHDARVVFLDLRFAGRELDRVLKRADLVDEAQLQRLLAGVDAPAGDFVERLLQLRRESRSRAP